MLQYPVRGMNDGRYRADSHRTRSEICTLKSSMFRYIIGYWPYQMSNPR